jgi:transposase
MTRWAGTSLKREQIVLFSPTLDSSIDEDHPVRLFDEILAEMDWSSWESHYFSGIGQPAIHPRVIASALLYGMSHGIRSSRRLEWACKNAIDFIWLVEGRQIDHSSFCNFRNRFKKELKSIFRQLGHIAMTMGMVRLNQIALDGTKIRANSHNDATAATIASTLTMLDEQIDKWFADADLVDKEDGVLFDNSESTALPRELSDLQKRRALLTKALNVAKEVDVARQKRSDRSKTPASIPVTDPDSRIMPNKEGGFAHNYTPVIAVDGECGFIVDTEVISGNDEPGITPQLIDQIKDECGQMPQQVLADGLFSSGSLLQWLDDHNIEAYIPVDTKVAIDDNPAVRADLKQPIELKKWSELPRSPQSKKLDRSAFIYDTAADCYYCPMGKQMPFSSSERARNSKIRRYECGYCLNCVLGSECLIGTSCYRTITRDEYQELREKTSVRMNSEEGKKTYCRRMWLTEGSFGLIKAWMGLRQFLCRGLEKVRTEWLWACMAYNLKKLVKAVLGIRQQIALLLA